MPSLYDTLKTLARQTATALQLPLGWEGEPFVVPAEPHLRGKVVVEQTKAIGLGVNGLMGTSGFLEFRVVVPAGQDALASGLADQIAGRFPLGSALNFDNGGGIFMTPGRTAPAGDGKRVTALVNITFDVSHAKTG